MPQPRSTLLWEWPGEAAASHTVLRHPLTASKEALLGVPSRLSVLVRQMTSLSPTSTAGRQISGKCAVKGRTRGWQAAASCSLQSAAAAAFSAACVPHLGRHSR